MSRERSQSQTSNGSSASPGAETNPAEGSEAESSNAARRHVLNPGVLSLHEKIYEHVEEYRHRREKMDHFSDRLHMVTSELRSRWDHVARMRDEIEAGGGRETTLFSAAVEANSLADAGAEETAEAVDQAERRAGVLHGVTGAQGGDMLQAAEQLAELDKSSKGREAGEARAIQAVRAIQTGERTTVESAEAAADRAGRGIFRQHVRSKAAEAFLDTMGDLEGEELRRQTLAAEALREAGVRLEGHKTIRIMVGDRTQSVMLFHVPHGYTFADLLADACDYWGVPRNRFCLKDPQTKMLWPLHRDVLTELEAMPSLMQAPTLLLVQRPAVSIADVTSYKHPIPVEQERIDIGQEEATGQRQGNDDRLAGFIPAINEDSEALVYEFLRYLAFMVVFMLVIYMRRNINQQFYVSSTMRNVLVERPFGRYMDKDFRDINSDTDLFDYMRGPLADAWFSADSNGYVAINNKWVGAIRVRQTRIVNNGNCEITPDMTAEWQGASEGLGLDESFAFVESCQGPYDPDFASKAPYGPGTGVPGWYYVDADAADAVAASQLATSRLADDEEKRFTSAPAFGDIADYDASGFIVELHKNFTRSGWSSYVDSLENEGWIDIQTRGVIITGTWYNPSYRYLAGAQLLVEFSDAGLVATQDKIFVLRPSQFDGAGNTFAAIAYFALVAFVLRQLAQDLQAAKKATFRTYYSDVFNLAAFVTQGCLVAGLILRIIVIADGDLAWLRSSGFTTPMSLDLGRSAILNSAGNGLDAFALLAAFFKLFKYFAVNFKLNVMWLTIKEAFKVIPYYLFIYFTFFLAFVVLTHNLFGAELVSYSSIVRTIRTLLLALLGSFDYAEVAEISAVWAPPIFLGYIVIMRFILFNLLLAIFNDSFAQVHTEHAEEEARLRKEGMHRESLTAAHLIGILIPSFSPTEQNREAYLREVDKARRKKEELLKKQGIAVSGNAKARAKKQAGAGAAAGVDGDDDAGEGSDQEDWELEGGEEK